MPASLRRWVTRHVRVRFPELPPGAEASKKVNCEQLRGLLIDLTGSCVGARSDRAECLSSIFFRLSLTEWQYTVGWKERGGVDYRNGWVSYDVLFGRPKCPWHPFLRRITADDRLVVEVQNRSSTRTIQPTLVMGMTIWDDLRGIRARGS